MAIGLALGAVACERPGDQPVKPQTSVTVPATPGSAPSRPSATDMARSDSPAVGPPPAGVEAEGGPVSGSDRAFVAEAALASLAEVEAGRYMADKAANGGVKAFAQQMERDHASAKDELQRIAGGKGIDLPTAVQGDDKRQLDKLKSVPSVQQDSEFVQTFGIDGNAKAIKLFERQAQSGQDSDLRAFAERTLPRLREHLGMAQQLQGKRAGAG
jgi:putative membrane protein